MPADTGGQIVSGMSCSAKSFCCESWSSTSASRSGGLQHAAHDLGGQRLRFGLQAALGRVTILLDVGLGGLHLRLSLVARFAHGRGARIERCLAASFLRAENRGSGLAEALLG